MTTLEILGALGTVVFACVWFVIAYGEWEQPDHSQDPYLNYGAYRSPGVLLTWGFALPIVVSAFTLIYLFWKFSWYALYAVTPVMGTFTWIGLKVVRRTAHIPKEIAAAIVYLSAYEVKRKPLEIADLQSVDGRLGKEHWTSIPIGIEKEYIYMNLDNRHYKLPWKALKSLERIEIKPPSESSYVSGLKLRFPTEIESTVVIAIAEREVDHILLTLNPELYGDASRTL